METTIHLYGDDDSFHLFRIGLTFAEVDLCRSCLRLRAVMPPIIREARVMFQKQKAQVPFTSNKGLRPNSFVQMTMKGSVPTNLKKG